MPGERAAPAPKAKRARTPARAPAAAGGPALPGPGELVAGVAVGLVIVLGVAWSLFARKAPDAASSQAAPVVSHLRALATPP